MILEKTLDKQNQVLNLIAGELSIAIKQVKNTISLLEEGNTVPFIARYRKEQTGALDEVQIRDIMERWQYIQNLNQRKEEVVRLIEEQGKLTKELKSISKSAAQKQLQQRKKGLNRLLNGFSPFPLMNPLLQRQKNSYQMKRK
jgi:uncharacterized protein